MITPMAMNTTAIQNSRLPKMLENTQFDLSKNASRRDDVVVVRESDAFRAVAVLERLDDGLHERRPAGHRR